MRKTPTELTPEQLDKSIARYLGWNKVRKKINSCEYTGVNPESNLRETIPAFSKCPEAIHIAENYVAQKVGMQYIIYLGNVLQSDNSLIEWSNIQQAFSEPHTRALACLIALEDIENEKELAKQKAYMA